MGRNCPVWNDIDREMEDNGCERTVHEIIVNAEYIVSRTIKKRLKMGQ